MESESSAACLEGALTGATVNITNKSVRAVYHINKDFQPEQTMVFLPTLKRNGLYATFRVKEPLLTTGLSALQRN